MTPKYATGPTPGSYIADRFDGEYVDLLLSWRPAAENTLRGRLSLSRTSHTEATQLDFTGLTGGILWTYAPSSRLALSASLTQNTGSGPNLFGLASQPTTVTGGGTTSGGTGSGSGSDSGSSGGNTGAGSTGSTGGSGTGSSSTSGGVPLTSDNNRLNTALGFSATYQATRTISLSGAVSFNHGDLVDASGSTGNAWTTTLGLA